MFKEQDDAGEIISKVYLRRIHQSAGREWGKRLPLLSIRRQPICGHRHFARSRIFLSELVRKISLDSVGFYAGLQLRDSAISSTGYHTKDIETDIKGKMFDVEDIIVPQYLAAIDTNVK